MSNPGQCQSGEEQFHVDQIAGNQNNVNENNSIQIHRSFANLPPEILEQIIIRIPAEERLVVAAICQSLRNEFLKTRSCWRGIRLCLNSNFYLTPLPVHRANFYPLTYVEDIQFTTAVPELMRCMYVDSRAEKIEERMVFAGNQQRQIPLELLSEVLQRASNLKRLDISTMLVDDANIAAFRALWFVNENDSSLKHLQLPSEIHVTSAWLRDLAAKHPRIEHLSLSPRCGRIVMDDCKNPFADFRSLKSLSLNRGHHRCHHRDRSVGPILDHLQISSLELRWTIFNEEGNYPPGPESQLPSHVTTPNLIKILVHLRIDDGVFFERAEYLIFYCRHLETLDLRHVTSGCDGENNLIYEEHPPLVLSPQQMSPFLRSTTFGFGWDQDPGNMYGYRRIMEISQLSQTISNIHFLGQPLPLDFFSAHSSRKWWSIISSISIRLWWTREQWLQLKSLLQYCDQLKSLSLYLKPIGGEGNAENGFADAPSKPLPPLDSLHFELWFDDRASEFQLVEEIMSSWQNVRRLSIDLSVPEEKHEFVSSQFFDTRFPLKNSVPASWQLEKCELRFEAVEFDDEDEEWTRLENLPKPVIPRTAWASRGSLQNLKALTLGCIARLESTSFATIVLATPQLEHFKSFHYGLGVSGLRLTDLPAVSGWRRLRTCHLILDVTEKDLASPPAPNNYGAQRKFAKLNNLEFVPRLVEEWKKQLRNLETMQVSCYVVKGNHDETQDPFHSLERVDYHLIFGSKCDSGRVHFCIDAEDPMARSFGILRHDE